MDLRKNVISIDAEVKRPRFLRRLALNSIAVMISDAVIVTLSLWAADWLLFLINGISFSIYNGILIVPAWALVSAVAKLLPGWGMGVVDELRRIQGALFVLFAAILLISFFTRITLSTSRIIFLFTYLFSAVLIPLARAIVRGTIIRMGQWGVPVSIYGDIESVETVIKALRGEMSLGYIPSAIFTNDAPQGTVVNRVSVHGSLNNTTFRTPVAIVAMTGASRHQLVETLEGPLEIYRRVIVVPDLLEAPSLWVVPRDLQGILESICAVV
jgi:FlaA1/EpsC-like NDP-sugar epimerase